MDQAELQTDRLLLRAFKLTDVHELNKLAGNINVAKTTLNVPHPYSMEMAKSWIDTHKSGWETKTNIVYAITLTKNEQLVGTIGLHDLKPIQAELGYWIGESYWGNGYCTEAAKAIIKLSFEQLGLRKIIAQHLKANPASGEVMKKSGMKHIGTIQNHDRNGNIADIERYEITSI